MEGFIRCLFRQNRARSNNIDAPNHESKDECYPIHNTLDGPGFLRIGYNILVLRKDMLSMICRQLEMRKYRLLR